MSRRNFVTALGAAGAAGAALVAADSVTRPKAVQAIGYSQSDVLNFALNLEYLEATFYSYIAQGTDLPASITVGSGPITNAPAKLTFTGTNAAQITDMLNEIYFDELNHVLALRSVLNSAAVVRPAINLGAYATITAANALLIARVFEDVGVTAYAGAASQLSGTNLTYAAQILAVEGFHSGAIRLVDIQQAYAYAPTVYLTFYGQTTKGSTAVSAITVSSISTTSGLAVGQTVTGTGIAAGTTITAVDPVGITVTLSAAATASTASNGFTIYTTTTPGDGNDVAPADPGTATAAAAGLSLIAGTSNPKVYQGFFATSGASNATETVPVGVAFERTTSQVLSIVYATAGVPPNPGVGVGGFFPQGMNGLIKTI